MCCMTAAILANRRRAMERADGAVEALASAQGVQVEASDAFVIDTPGG